MNRVSWKNWLIVGCLGVVGLSSCTEPGEALRDRKRRENEAEIAQYVAQNNLTEQARTTDAGTTYIITTTNPTGQTAGVGDEIQYHYVARRFDGLIVDSSDVAANIPRVLTRGYFNQALISAGLYDGIVNSGPVVSGTNRLGLRKGESAMLLVPFNLDNGRPNTLLLPQYLPIRYDVRIVNVRTEEQQIQEYLTANKLTPTFSETNGLRVVVTQARPDSVQVTTGKTVGVSYRGSLLNGVVFDPANNPTGTNTISVQIGANQVVPGFDQGLAKLRKGEKARLIFPSALGYGITGSGATIRPYASLVFDVEITSVQ